ncbi:CCR4-NOT transcription complex subunit 8 [Homalodisca vitripennis]|nr:CCR4-NOT transcription complex subunit 8 [Homalodisca vitripennis]
MEGQGFPVAGPSRQGPDCGIMNVWRWNLEEEFAKMVREIHRGYTFVAMDTEFPGEIIRSLRPSVLEVDGYEYARMVFNVQRLKIIQLGLSLFTSRGLSPPGCHTWQFHFKFCLEKNAWTRESVDILKRAGVDFGKQKKEGIDIRRFANLFVQSPLFRSLRITWITFHGRDTTLTQGRPKGGGERGGRPGRCS